MIKNTSEPRFETILKEIQDDLEELGETLSKLQGDITDISELVAGLSSVYINTVRLLSDELKKGRLSE